MAPNPYRDQTVAISGLRELVAATGGYRTELAKEIRTELRKAAVVVAKDARQRFAGYTPRGHTGSTMSLAKSAQGFVPQARATGRASVVQRRRKVRPYPGRPDYGALQMKHGLLPALYAKTPEVEAKVEQMLDRLGGEHF